MKQRIGLVSNSSSSSFVIKKRCLTEAQVLKIENHIDHWNKNFSQLSGNYSVGEDDGWDIEVTEEFVSGDTYMDNFSMSAFLDGIGVKEEDINWD